MVHENEWRTSANSRGMCQVKETAETLTRVVTYRRSEGELVPLGDGWYTADRIMILWPAVVLAPRMTPRAGWSPDPPR